MPWFREITLHIRKLPKCVIVFSSLLFLSLVFYGPDTPAAFSKENVIPRGATSLKEAESLIRVVCFGDTHARHRSILVPDADILVFTGDCTDPTTASSKDEQLRQIWDFNNWVNSLPHKHKFFVAGNHDPENGISLGDLKREVTSMQYLQDESVSIQVKDRRVEIYGSPWQPQYPGYLTYAEPGFHANQIGEKWNRTIPNSVDILATHTPPKGILDSGIGSDDLTEILVKIKPSLHCFGHIHKGRQKEKPLRKSLGKKDSIFVNGAIVNDNLVPVWKPVAVTLPSEV